MNARVRMEQQKCEGEGEKSLLTPPSESKQVPKGEGRAATGAEEAKSVYLFVCHLHGPNAQALYAVDFPLPVGSPEQERPLSPLVEFPRAKYPLGMCAVEFDSKLYILGGEFDKPSLGGPPWDSVDVCLYPRDVHIFDPNSTCPSSLKVGPKMYTGKLKPYAFVADSKIYVLSGLIPVSSKTGQNLSRFEVFKPDVDGGGGGTWTQLEDPPFQGTMFTGHAVINKQVFFSTCAGKFLCFDLDSSEWWLKIRGGCSSCWTKVSEKALIWGFSENSVPPPFNSSTELVEGTLFCCYDKYGVASFVPPVANNRWSQEKEEKADLLPNLIKMHREIVYPSVSLTHTGERLFCHVLLGNQLCSSHDRTKCYVNLTMFEALKDYSEGSTFFGGKFLRSALFVIMTKGLSALIGAFAIPSLIRCR